MKPITLSQFGIIDSPIAFKTKQFQHDSNHIWIEVFIKGVLIEETETFETHYKESEENRLLNKWMNIISLLK